MLRMVSVGRLPPPSIHRREHRDDGREHAGGLGKSEVGGLKVEVTELLHSHFVRRSRMAEAQRQQEAAVGPGETVQGREELIQVRDCARHVAYWLRRAMPSLIPSSRCKGTAGFGKWMNFE